MPRCHETSLRPDAPSDVTSTAGTLRLYRIAPASAASTGGDAYALHTCDAADTTAYVKYSDECPEGVVLASSPRADIDGFITSPTSGAVEAVVVTEARTELLPLGEGGRRLQVMRRWSTVLRVVGVGQ